MGTHTSSPSHLLGSTVPLSEHLASHPELMGPQVILKFGTSDGNLPFLFKVLSIQKALSIQSHPDKATAEKLHATQPKIYKDPNHKPEMALAITPFHALCGFKPLSAIVSAFSATPEFAALVPPSARGTLIQHSASGNPTSPDAKAALRDVFSAVMTAEELAYKSQLSSILDRYSSGKLNPHEDIGSVELVQKLNSQFPGDIGIFCVFMLNHVILEPGQAIFLGAGEPHAYVSGECMECMANSDNVIRAGLTPKLRDIPNLISGLTYIASPPTKHYVSPSPFSGPEAVSSLYDPPVPEFSVVQVKLPARKEETHRAVNGPSIAIVTDGAGIVSWGDKQLEVGLGTVFFIGAGTEIRLGVVGEQQLVVYRALVEA